MNKLAHLILVALASSIAAASIQAAPQRSDAGPPVRISSNASGNAIDLSNPQADVVAVAQENDGAGSQLTVRSVQAPATPDAPRPSFNALDTNHDGVISESEAEAYSPLANDYLHLAHKGSRGVTRAEYDHWHRARTYPEKPVTWPVRFGDAVWFADRQIRGNAGHAL